MKKLLLPTLILTLSCLALSCLNHSPASAKDLAVVDTNKIFEESKHGKAVIAYFETLQNNGIKELEAIEAQRKQAEESKDEKLLQNLEEKMQSLAYSLQSKMQTEQEILFQAITEKLTLTLDNYRKTKELDVILHTVDLASFDPEIEITNKIIQEFDKLEFDIQKELQKKQSSQ